MKDLQEIAELTSASKFQPKNGEARNGSGNGDQDQNVEVKGRYNSNMKSLFYPDVDEGQAGLNGNTDEKKKMEENAGKNVDHKEGEQDPEVLAQLLREGQPMRLTNWFVDRPCTVMLTGFGILILITAASYLLGFFKMNEQHRREYLIWDDKLTNTYDMRQAAIDEILASKGEQKQPERF